MDKYIPFYIKLFALSTLYWGIGFSICFTIYDLSFGFKQETLASRIVDVLALVWPLCMLMGLLFSLIGGSIHILRVRSLSTDEPKNLSAIQTRVLLFEEDQNTIFKTCISSLISVNGKITERSMPFRITASTSRSWKSWGEHIEFTISPAQDSRMIVKVTSRPRLVMALVDYGTSIENLEKICQYLKEKLN